MIDEERYDIGALLVRRTKHGPRCGDMFVVVEKLEHGYRLLSIRKNGHMTITYVRDEIAHNIYDFIGSTFNINELLDLAKDIQ